MESRPGWKGERAVSRRNRNKAVPAAEEPGPRAPGPGTTETGRPAAVIPVIEEEMHVGRRRRVTGKVRLTRTVRQQEVTVDEPLLSERVEVERVEVNRPVDTPPEPRCEGETLVLPVVEEVLVVEKRLILKEEIRVRRVRDVRHEPQRVLLQKEEILVERETFPQEKESR